MISSDTSEGKKMYNAWGEHDSIAMIMRDDDNNNGSRCGSIYVICVDRKIHMESLIRFVIKCVKEMQSIYDTSIGRQ